MKKHSILFLTFSIVAAGCSTNAATVSDFVEACSSATNLEEPICQCSGEKAQQELSPKALEFLIASLNQDDSKTTQLRTELSIDELTQASLFMVDAPAECAGELGAEQ